MKTKSVQTLEQVCLFIADCLHNTAPTQDEGYPLIRTPNIGRGRLELDGVYRVSEDTYKIWTRRAIPQTDDLVLAREAPAGNVAIIREGQTVCLGQRTVHLRPDPEQVDPNFLCYFLLTPEQQGALLAGETGATSKHVNMSDIRKLALPNLPSLKVQRKIGNILSAYDDLITNNRRRIQLLEQAAREIYKEWFVRLRFPGHEQTRVVDGVPVGWDYIPFEDALVLQRGFDLTESEREEGDVPVYGSTGLNGFHNKAMAKAPGVVTGRSGTLGKVTYVEQDYWPHNTALWVREFKKVSPLFAFFLLQEMKLEQYNGGVSVPTLDRKAVHRVQVLIPPQKLIDALDENIKPIFAQTSNLRRQIESLAQARDILLPRLMSGAIAPTP